MRDPKALYLSGPQLEPPGDLVPGQNRVGMCGLHVPSIRFKFSQGWSPRQSRDRSDEATCVLGGHLGDSHKKSADPAGLSLGWRIRNPLHGGVTDASAGGEACLASSSERW